MALLEQSAWTSALVPSAKMDFAKTVQVVVPSPDSSLLILAASINSLAPILWS